MRSVEVHRAASVIDDSNPAATRPRKAAPSAAPFGHCRHRDREAPVASAILFVGRRRVLTGLNN